MTEEVWPRIADEARPHPQTIPTGQVGFEFLGEGFAGFPEVHGDRDLENGLLVLLNARVAGCDFGSFKEAILLSQGLLDEEYFFLFLHPSYEVRTVSACGGGVFNEVSRALDGLSGLGAIHLLFSGGDSRQILGGVDREAGLRTDSPMLCLEALSRSLACGGELALYDFCDDSEWSAATRFLVGDSGEGYDTADFAGCGDLLSSWKSWLRESTASTPDGPSGEADGRSCGLLSLFSSQSGLGPLGNVATVRGPRWEVFPASFPPLRATRGEEASGPGEVAIRIDGVGPLDGGGRGPSRMDDIGGGENPSAALRNQAPAVPSRFPEHFGDADAESLQALEVHLGASGRILRAEVSASPCSFTVTLHPSAGEPSGDDEPR